MVVGGYPSSAFGVAEILDLTGESTNCASIPDFPVDYASVGTFINGKALVCGGTNTSYSGSHSQTCYSYVTGVKKSLIRLVFKLFKIIIRM